jgi:urease accessory protein
MNSCRRASAVTIALLMCGVAAAHPGHAPLDALSGAAHPLTGVDHVLAMVAVGLCAGQMRGGARWLVPLAFVMSMAAGALLSLSGLLLPHVELGIAGSVAVLGVLVALTHRISMIQAILLVGFFALFHGYAHLSEAAPGTGALPFLLGFTISTAMLHALGLLTVVACLSMTKPQVVRWTGYATACCGVILLLTI